MSVKLSNCCSHVLCMGISPAEGRSALQGCSPVLFPGDTGRGISMGAFDISTPHVGVKSFLPLHNVLTSLKDPRAEITDNCELCAWLWCETRKGAKILSS